MKTNSNRPTPRFACRVFRSVRAILLTQFLLSSAFAPKLAPAENATAELLSTEKVFSANLSDTTQGFHKLSPEESGLDFVARIDPDHPLRRLYVTGYAGGGISINDFNGDGRPDIFIASGPEQSRVYLQTSRLRFEDVSKQSGISNFEGWHTGVASADIDADGDIDVLVCRYEQEPLLFINDGVGKFTESAQRFGLTFKDACMMPSFVDYDLDGRLDLFILNNRLCREGGFPGKAALKEGVAEGELLEEMKKYYRLTKDAEGKVRVKNVGRQDLLFRNTLLNGETVFTDVTAHSKIQDRGMGLSSLWWDVNNDSYPDLHVANDFEEPDALWLNLGDGTFRDVLKERIPHTSWFSMGSDFGDLNNDGHWDLLVADMAGSNHFRQKLAMGSMNNQRILEVAGPPPQLMRNALLYGTGTERFIESAFMSKLAKTDWTWSVKMLDLDNDGLLDVFFTNGATRDFMDADTIASRKRFENIEEWDVFRDTPPRREKNLAFRNKDGMHFRSIGEQWGLDHFGMSYGAAASDLDRDGDLDLVIINLDEPSLILRNDQNSGNSVLIRLASTQSAPQGLGARVALETSKDRQTRQLVPVRGFNSSDEPLLHFGLGAASSIERLTVYWPKGVTQVFESLEANRFYQITEPKQGGSEEQKQKQEKPLYQASPLLTHVGHKEHPFDDFAQQPLLPNKLSQLGPGHAWGDVDNDGDYDLFLGGAAGELGQLLLQDRPGHFIKASFPALEQSRASEDMGAVLIDVEGDGDLDLYIASGGVESSPESAHYHDRLYLNDGSANFTLAPVGAIPARTGSGGPVVAADFDKDGDLDLFVGGRLLPGNYPRSGASVLLENKSETSKPYFEDVTEQRAKGLQEAGMITAALWSDIDGDSDLDLLLTREWGAPMLWRNTGKEFKNDSSAAGFDTHSGWWNGLTGADFDGDGDIDLAATNFGLNTKYHASTTEPVRVYSGSFVGSKEPRIIEAEYENGVLFPVRGKGCSTAAIPGLAEKYSSYRDFALAELDEIYSQEELRRARVYEAYTLESSVFFNDGTGKFDRISLPPLAQISPGFGILAGDVDGDARTDLMIAQNFFTPQLETGRMDSGLSVILLGDGNGKFRSVWPEESGILNWGDAKSSSLIDLNSDSRPDILIAQNDDTLRTYVQSPDVPKRYLRLKLKGLRGNPQAVGAKVSLLLPHGQRQTYEIYAGSGYLSQSPSDIFFGLADEDETGQLEIRWPNGSILRKDIGLETGTLTLSQGD